MSGYDPRARTAAGNRRRLGRQASGIDDATLHVMAQIMAATRCAKGEHRTETDSETGDEVCRLCGAVVE